MEVDTQDVQGLTLLAKPAPRQSYAPMAFKPPPSNHDFPLQQNQAPVTDLSVGKNGGSGMGVKEWSKG